MPAVAGYTMHESLRIAPHCVLPQSDPYAQSALTCYLLIRVSVSHEKVLV